MKKILAVFLIFAMSLCVGITSFAENTQKIEAENQTNQTMDKDITCKSAVLMEASSGRVLYSKNEGSSYSPASVTKIMTLLLVAEALAENKFSVSDTVTVSEYASSMGGSQVFLKEGESISVEELIKCTVIASANDAAVALAELVAGSESAFVSKMNARAMELGLKGTSFENVTGLDDTTVNHVTSALDIAVMSRELIKHEIIMKYSGLWQDSIRNGEFILTNTNRLVRFYDGCTGLKTGSTDKAGYCMSATAERGGMKLIAVVMGAETRDSRNEIARKLLDYGFASYSLFSMSEQVLEEVPVLCGVLDSVTLYSAPFSLVVNKTDSGKIEKVYKIPESIQAPVVSGEAQGSVEYILNGEKIGESTIYAKTDVEKINFLQLYGRLLQKIFGEK